MNKNSSKLIASSFNWLNVLVVVFGLMLMLVAWQLVNYHHLTMEIAVLIGVLFLFSVGYFYFNHHVAKRISKEGLVSKYPFTNVQKFTFYFLLFLSVMTTAIPINGGNSIKLIIGLVPCDLPPSFAPLIKSHLRAGLSNPTVA